MFYLLVTLLVTHVVTVSGNIISKYTQTKVVEELESCTITDINKGAQKKTISVIECGKLCSNTDECRRFMFDTSDFSCILFESGENCIAKSVYKKVCYKQDSVCDESLCRKCPVGYYGNRCEYIITDCHDGHQRSFPNKEIITYIQPSIFGPVVEVICSFGSSVTYILNRNLACQSVDFNQTWEKYANGFGYVHGDFWMGLKNIYNFLQLHEKVNFQVILKTYSGLTYHAYYHTFNLSSESQDFRLQLSTFSDVSEEKVTGDSLTKGLLSIDGNVFSTYDRDHTGHQCPQRLGGGWWYVNNPNCSRANLFGKSKDSDTEAKWNWLDTETADRNFTKIQIKCRVY